MLKYTIRHFHMPDYPCETKGVLPWGILKASIGTASKKDLQKGMEKGMAAMKKGAIVAQKTTGDL